MGEKSRDLKYISLRAFFKNLRKILAKKNFPLNPSINISKLKKVVKKLY